MAVTQETLDEIALSRAEYNLILERLDREPNAVELGMFGALWSEHCGDKHSRPLLRLFAQDEAARAASRVLSQTGAENAGAVDIGDGLAVVFKVESHNHPSAVEPLQGAATGVGGIPRGRITEVFGPESSGKTTLCLTVCANAQKSGGVVAYIDAEHALDPAYARKIGVDLEALLVSQPDSGEQALEQIERADAEGEVSVQSGFQRGR